ncbi:MAG: hypothetical protein KAT70_03430 [Thermoplasmata archaeon]|nr:hypothetical protein [Thermoplasmata archaeon]
MDGGPREKTPEHTPGEGEAQDLQPGGSIVSPRRTAQTTAHIQEDDFSRNTLWEHHALPPLDYQEVPGGLPLSHGGEDFA